MQRISISEAWRKWKRDFPKQYDRFRKEFKIVAKDKESEFPPCDLYKDYDKHRLCDICMIESCKSNPSRSVA